MQLVCNVVLLPVNFKCAEYSYILTKLKYKINIGAIVIYLAKPFVYCFIKRLPGSFEQVRFYIGFNINYLFVYIAQCLFYNIFIPSRKCFFWLVVITYMRWSVEVINYQSNAPLPCGAWPKKPSCV
jgi:hypothetical protein